MRAGGAVGSRAPPGARWQQPGRRRTGGAPGGGTRSGRAPNGGGRPNRRGCAEVCVDGDHVLYRWRCSPSPDRYHVHHEI
jgi:hypothetical protein